MLKMHTPEGADGATGNAGADAATQAAGASVATDAGLLPYDPIDLLRRVMDASGRGQIRGLYGPLHYAITKTIEAAASAAASGGIGLEAEACASAEPAKTGGEPPEGKGQEATEYRLLTVWGDVEPSVGEAAFDRYDDLVAAAREHRETQGSDDGLYGITVSRGASVDVFPFAGAELSGDEED